MANTLTVTSLLENIYRAKDQVAAEPTGFIQSVMVNSGSEGVSLGGTVLSHTTAAPTLNSTYTPSMTLPDGDDQTVSTASMTIGQVANVRIPFKGETLKQIMSTAGQKVVDDMFAQAIRKIRNAIEAHLGTTLKNGASRATGTAGTSPFATNINPLVDARQILLDNGCPMDDGELSLVINSLSGTKLRQIANLYKVNEAGDSALLRRGELTNLMGISIKESAGVATHTKGGATGQLINNGNIAIGSTTLTLDTITVNTTGLTAGDIFYTATEGSGGNRYVIKTGLVATAGDIVINNPGLVVATANNDALTLTNTYTGNSLFHRNAVELVMRPPAQPYGGDAATDRATIVDDKTGLVFEVATYKGYGMSVVDITCLYQAKVWKSEFVATLLG